MLKDLTALLEDRDAARLRRLTALLALAAALQGAVLVLAVPVFQRLLDGDPDTALPWLAVAAAACALYAAVQWGAQAMAFRVGGETARALHRLLGDRLPRLPLGWFTRARTGQVVEIATAGIPQLMSYPAILLRPLVTALVTPAVTVVGLALWDGRYALTVALTGCAAAAVTRFARRRVADAERERHRALDEAAGRVLEFATAQQVLRAFGRSDAGALDDALVHADRAARRSMTAIVPGLVVFSFAVQLAFACCLSLALALLVSGDLTAGACVGLLVVTTRLVAIGASGAELAAASRTTGGTIDRVASVLTAPALPEPATAAPESGDGPVAEFRDVVFGYGGDPVLRNVSFTLPRRGLTALVGPSGSGKTTVTRLLARFWDVDEGAVLVCGRDVREAPSDEVLARIAPVFQDVHLFDDTVAANIRLGRPDAGDAEFDEAVALAGVAEMARDLPDGLDTRVGEGGARLSGGQRQRVAIARAILKAAPLTVLDEATAALDPENALVVRRTLDVLRGRGSVLVIAHHLATVRDADRIVVLDGGRVADRGTHDELAGRPGLYREFTEGRAGDRGWRFAAVGRARS
ncbi:ABC transporter ATP-binding protein [Streptomyces sp. RFCAC02]|uniref:ABC transporter ATP-binding protein n=1 Tax=Streptomyces sp. RFCAC02 TaxID=2499143 RepID=UPI00101FC644|nr:ABC transporter ATP-binding protein [Streptomyces sp. RFCAC02]